MPGLRPRQLPHPRGDSSQWARCRAVPPRLPDLTDTRWRPSCLPAAHQRSKPTPGKGGTGHAHAAARARMRYGAWQKQAERRTALRRATHRSPRASLCFDVNRAIRRVVVGLTQAHTRTCTHNGLSRPVSSMRAHIHTCTGKGTVGPARMLKPYKHIHWQALHEAETLCRDSHTSALCCSPFLKHADL